MPAKEASILLASSFALSAASPSLVSIVVEEPGARTPSIAPLKSFGEPSSSRFFSRLHSSSFRSAALPCKSWMVEVVG